MNGLEYGNEDILDSGVDYAILDTGTSLLYIGASDYTAFISKLIGSQNGGDLNCQD